MAIRRAHQEPGATGRPVGEPADGDHDLLLRRHDYRGDVAGSFPAAQYVHDIVDVDGFRFPTKRRACVRGPDLRPIRDLLMVSIDLNDFRFS